MEPNNQDSVNQNVTSRRKFLTKSSAGILLAALPAKSVWATGGNVAGSIVASGNSSDWAGGNPIKLRSHGYWKNHLGNVSDDIKNAKFKNAFGAHPEDDYNNDLIVKRAANKDFDQPYSNWFPALKHIISSEGDSGIILWNGNNNNYPFVTDTNVNPCFTGNFKGNKSWKPLFDLSGASNVNVQMVAMYFNAAYHGSYGIYYPVLSQHGGPFANLDTFADNLIQLRDTNGASALGNALEDLIDENPA